MGINMKSKLRHSAANRRPKTANPNQLSQNTKAQLEIVALAFMVAGVVIVATAGLLSTGGGAKARAAFEQNFIFTEHKLGATETFYSSLVNLAGRN